MHCFLLQHSMHSRSFMAQHFRHNQLMKSQIALSWTRSIARSLHDAKSLAQTAEETVDLQCSLQVVLMGGIACKLLHAQDSNVCCKFCLINICVACCRLCLWVELLPKCCMLKTATSTSNPRSGCSLWWAGAASTSSLLLVASKDSHHIL